DSFATRIVNTRETLDSYGFHNPRGRRSAPADAARHVRSMPERSTRMPQFPPRRRGLKLAIAAGATAFGTLLITSGVAWAEKSPPPDTSTVEGLGIATNILWTTIGAVLVIFMQAGFALVETGFCRAKHAAHVVSTNFAIFGLGFIAYFIVGYSFMFGGYGSSLLDFAAPGKSLIGSGNWSFLWWS